MIETINGILGLLSEPMYEAASDLQEVLAEWEFVNIWILVSVIVLIGSGFVPYVLGKVGDGGAKLKGQVLGVAWGVSLAALWAALHIGIGRGEFGEVMFNGTLL